MPDCYAIKDWSKHFENSESRKYKSLSWVPMKNKHDGKGYRRVCQHPQSVQVFCAWCLLVQVASKMPVRGVLRDDDGPLTASDLSAKTGLPEAIFTEAFTVLTDGKIGWLILDPSEPAGISPNLPGETNGEQNRTEQTGMEQNNHPPKSALMAVDRGFGGKTADSRAESPSLTMESLPRVARAALDSPWHYDNCKVTPDMFTVASLVAVLRPFATSVTEAAVIACFHEAIQTAHARCVDAVGREAVLKPGALAITILKDLLRQKIQTP